MRNGEVYVELRLARPRKRGLRYAVALAKRLRATLVVVSPPDTDANRVRAVVAACVPTVGSFDHFFPLKGSVPRLTKADVLVGAFPKWPNTGARRSRRIFTNKKRRAE